MSRRREAQELAQALALSTTSGSSFEPFVEVPSMPRTSPRQSSQRTPPGRRASAHSRDADAASPGRHSTSVQRHDADAVDARRPARNVDSMAIHGGVLSDAASRETHAKRSKRQSSPSGNRRRKSCRHGEDEHENVQDKDAGDQKTEETATVPEVEGNAAGEDEQPEEDGGADGDAEDEEQEDAAGTNEPSTDDKQAPAAADTCPDSSRPPSKDAQATPDRHGASSERKKRLYGKPLSQLLRGGRAQSPSVQAGGSPGGLRATGLQRTARVPPLHVNRRSPPPPRPKIPKKEDKKAEEEDESAENDGVQASSVYPFVDYDVEEGFL